MCTISHWKPCEWFHYCYSRLWYLCFLKSLTSVLLDVTVRRKNYNKRFRNQTSFVKFAVCTKYCKFTCIYFTWMVLCVCERERERERQTDRRRDRDCQNRMERFSLFFFFYSFPEQGSFHGMYRQMQICCAKKLPWRRQKTHPVCHQFANMWKLAALANCKVLEEWKSIRKSLISRHLSHEPHLGVLKYEPQCSARKRESFIPKWNRFHSKR
jgi:hypothetical protein